MTIQFSQYLKGPRLHYSVALLLALLGGLFCYLVYQSGQLEELQIGARYLAGLPNYYLFYPLILPFVAAGVIFIGRENRQIRFVGEISDKIEADLRRKIRQRQRLMLILCVLFSVFAVIADSAEKNFSLPPYAYQFSAAEAEQRVAATYACLQAWTDGCAEIGAQSPAERYAQALADAGIQVSSITGFAHFGEWLEFASWLYYLESFLSLLASLVISLFIAEVLLLISVKDHTPTSINNLLIWMLMLCSLWFPSKIYSAWYHSLGVWQSPQVFVIGLIVLAIGIAAVFFIKSSQKEIEKYGQLVVGLFSFALVALSYLRPELFARVSRFVSDLSLFYMIILLGIVSLLLFSVTEYFIGRYAKEIEAED